MITGVETAGLVLAAFPLLISALEHYREGFEPLADWWKFRTEFVAFIHVIDRQSLLFSENLEELLSPIISSEGEMGALLQNPLGPAWRDPRLESNLEDRLPKSYESYRNTIEDMNSCMAKLQEKLGIKDGKLTWVNDETGSAKNRVRCEFEFRRIKYVLAKKKRERLVRELTSNNEELRKIFTSSERLASHRKKRRMPNAFKRIRDQACGLYSALQTGWRCQCPQADPSHHANLLLEKRFDGIKARKHIKRPQSESSITVLFWVQKNSQKDQLIWHETEIRLLEADDCQIVHQMSTLSHNAQNADFNGIVKTFETGSAGLTLPFRKRPKHVTFPQITLQPPKLKETSHQLIEIADLCAAVQKACSGQGHLPLGYLKDLDNRRHAFYPSTPPPVFDKEVETISLASLLLKSDPGLEAAHTYKLSRFERYTVAVVLASSLLQLYSSPWVGETWSKEDIHFMKAPAGALQSVLIDRPYISRKFTSYTPETCHLPDCRPTQYQTSTKNLQALGIMLLELCFGEAIEDQPIREKYLGRDGQPNDMTDFSTAQHWWQNYALGEGGPEFYEAIRRCLFCAFGPKSTDLEDDELRSAVYNEVVEPLDGTVRQFSSNG
ncbi:uncharacterized protein KY384_006663 [Bacidia gigantensis]|uniref:uncharacterized protein n=1 Tax=Bacidia gigantensis TaxID=2732470 RepID=UPI001D053E23|nr:uncharacterized protein KY384_006663 [Bacidia gigantensis]KAG8528974.1 hypothetical protein KY384_006663 [Bacidia gigantensis]